MRSRLGLFAGAAIVAAGAARFLILRSRTTAAPAAIVAPDSPEEQSGITLLGISRATGEDPVPTCPSDPSLVPSAKQLPNTTLFWFRVPETALPGPVGKAVSVEFANEKGTETLSWSVVDADRWLCYAALPPGYPGDVREGFLEISVRGQVPGRWHISGLPPASRIVVGPAQAQTVAGDVRLSASVAISDRETNAVRFDLQAEPTPGDRLVRALQLERIDFEWEAQERIPGLAPQAAGVVQAGVPTRFRQEARGPFLRQMRWARLRGEIVTYRVETHREVVSGAQLVPVRQGMERYLSSQADGVRLASGARLTLFVYPSPRSGGKRFPAYLVAGLAYRPSAAPWQPLPEWTLPKGASPSLDGATAAECRRRIDGADKSPMVLPPFRIEVTHRTEVARHPFQLVVPLTSDEPLP